MTFDLNLLETLLKEKRVEIDTGVFLCCDEQLIHLDIFVKGGNIVIEFNAPFTYLHIEKIGPQRLLNLVKPRVELLTITEKSYIVKLSSLGNWEFARD